MSNASSAALRNARRVFIHQAAILFWGDGSTKGTCVSLEDVSTSGVRLRLDAKGMRSLQKHEGSLYLYWSPLVGMKPFKLPLETVWKHGQSIGCTFDIHNLDTRFAKTIEKVVFYNRL